MDLLQQGAGEPFADGTDEPIRRQDDHVLPQTPLEIQFADDLVTLNVKEVSVL